MADWRQNLDDFFHKTERKPRAEKEQSELARFIATVAIPAFEEIRLELVKHGREGTIRDAVNSAVLIVSFKGEEEMTYRIQSRTFPDRVLPFAEVRARERRGLKLIRIESMFRSGKPDYLMTDITQEEVIKNFLEHYTRRVQTG